MGLCQFFRIKRSICVGCCSPVLYIVFRRRIYLFIVHLVKGEQQQQKPQHRVLYKCKFECKLLIALSKQCHSIYFFFFYLIRLSHCLQIHIKVGVFFFFFTAATFNTISPFSLCLLFLIFFFVFIVFLMCFVTWVCVCVGF